MEAPPRRSPQRDRAAHSAAAPPRSAPGCVGGAGVNGPEFVYRDARNGLRFSSRFDSGNLQRAERAADGTYELWTAPDNFGTPHERTCNSWFYFEVSHAPATGEEAPPSPAAPPAAAPAPAGQRNAAAVCAAPADAHSPLQSVLRFRVMNMKRHGALFRQGYRPVYLSSASGSQWRRLPTAVAHHEEEGEGGEVSFRIEFSFPLRGAGDLPLRFAFCYPHSYEDCQRWLDRVESAAAALPGVFCQRELLARSLEGRRVDLLSITSAEGADAQGRREAPLLDPQGALFPEPRAARPPLFDRPTVVLSARVHPGETPGQFALQGAVAFLLRGGDPRAAALRGAFNFKLLPMLNPDGVARGHFRTDTGGRNLNRFYTDPDAASCPTIYAARAVVLHAAAGGTGGEGLALYVDLHAHASKRGCFMYGNAVAALERQVENQLFALLVSLNSPHLDYGACNFTRKHMTRCDRGDDGRSAEGTGRVALHLASGALRCYTLECNYNTDRTLNAIVDPKALAAAPEERRSASRAPRRSRTAPATKAFRSAQSAASGAPGDVECGVAACDAQGSRAPPAPPPPEGAAPGVERQKGMEGASVPRQQGDGGGRTPRRGPGASAPRPYTVASWANVGEALLVALLDAEGKNPWSRVPGTRYKSLEGARKALASEIRSAAQYRRESLRIRQGAVRGRRRGARREPAALDEPRRREWIYGAAAQRSEQE